MNPSPYVQASLLAVLVNSGSTAAQAPAAVSCTQDSYALCAYSKCTVNDDAKTASCPCYELSGPSLARIDVIPDEEVMRATMEECTDAAACAEGNAPICDAIADGTLWPGADAVSTFSRAREVENGLVLDANGARGDPNWKCDAPEGGRLVPNCMLAPCRSLAEPVTDPYFDGEATMECTCPLIRADEGYAIFGGLEDPCDADSFVNTGGPALVNHAKDGAAVASAWDAVREAFNGEATEENDDGGADSGSPNTPVAVSCTQDSYALCAYAKCTMNDDMKTASCPCYELSGPSFARLDVIPDAEVMKATMEKCTDPTACAEGNAPICDAIGDGTLWPGADAVSTFSRAREVENGVALNAEGGRGDPNWKCDAPEFGRMVPNCMLAPCRSLTEPITDPYFDGEATMECTCPLIKADVDYTIFGGMEDPCDGESLVNTGGPVLVNHAKDSAAVASAWEAVRDAFNSEAKDDVAGKTISIDGWELPYNGPNQVAASVGDTITFSWSRGGHNVYIHPTMDCTLDGRINVGKDAAGTSYTFLESDAGNDLFFSCDIGEGAHCSAGQSLTVSVAGGDGHEGAQPDEDEPNKTEAEKTETDDAETDEAETDETEPVAAPGDTDTPDDSAGGGRPLAAATAMLAAVALVVALSA